MKMELDKKTYERKLKELQLELIRLQDWIVYKGLKVVVLFEGRDAAGKGGAIKRITESLNPRVCRIVALPKPTEKEKTQWYFQRYVKELPAAGEMVLFDRSWYNRAGVEKVMGYCTDEEYWNFIDNVPAFESLLVDSGIILIKYWFSVSDEVQEQRFRDRINDETKRWKFSPVDLASRTKWYDYTKAKDIMFQYTDNAKAPWYSIDSDVKRNARINCIAHLLSMIPYEDLPEEKIELPPKQKQVDYQRPPIERNNWVPDIAAALMREEDKKDKKKEKDRKDRDGENDKERDGKERDKFAEISANPDNEKTKKKNKKKDKKKDKKNKKKQKDHFEFE